MKTWFRMVLKKALLSDRERGIQLLGRRLYCRPRRDFHLFRLAQSHRLAPSHHEISAMMSLMSFTASGVTFVDVGANIGLYSATFAAVGEALGFDVIAIEPNIETALLLEKTLSQYSNCTVHNCACSNKNGVATLRHGVDSQTAFIDSPYNNRKIHHGQRTSSVESRTLDSMLEHISGQIILKIDVEGHEREVLEGASEILRSRRANTILIDSTGDIDKQWLRSLGYTSYDANSMAKTDEAYSLLYVLS